MTLRSGLRRRAWRHAAAAFLAGCVLIGAGASPASAAGPGDGSYKLVGLGDKCMDVAGGDPNPGTPIILHTCNFTAAQQWRYDSDDYQLEAFGKCLDVPGGRFVNRNQLRLWTCNHTPGQQFRLYPTEGGYTIRPFRPYSFCVEVAGGSTADWTPIQLYDCNGTASQVWRFRWL